MGLLQGLFLEGTAIVELPSSVECLTGLNFLYLVNCKNLVRLPNTVCNLTSLEGIDLFGCSKLEKLHGDLGKIVSLTELNLSGTAIIELPSSVKFLNGLTSLHLRECKKFDKLPEDLGNFVSLEMLDLRGTAITELPLSIEFLIGLGRLYLDGCLKFVNLPENLGNLEHLNRLSLEGTAIEVLPSSVERLAALKYLKLKDCKNLVCLSSTICNLRGVEYLDIMGCSKIANLPENLGNMESLRELLLGGTAIKELPSSIIHHKYLDTVSFKGCQLSSSSLTSMPISYKIDLSDCNLSAIPSGIDCINQCFGYWFNLYLMGNDFVSLPESISQLSSLTSLYLDGCKSLRSLSNIQIPSKVGFICVDNCTSLERLPEPPNDFYWSSYENFTVQCFNCFKLAYNIQTFSNMFQGQSGKQFEKCYIIPGREIPKWFEKVNICDTIVVRDYKIKKVMIQLPGSGSGCDEWRGIVLCVVFLPTERHNIIGNGCQMRHHGHITVNRCQMRGFKNNFSLEEYANTLVAFPLEYGEVETHHLWLHSVQEQFPLSGNSRLRY